MLQNPTFLKIVEHITVVKNVWSWPARAQGKWRLNPDLADYLKVTTTEYDKKERESSTSRMCSTRRTKPASSRPGTSS